MIPSPSPRDSEHLLSVTAVCGAQFPRRRLSQSIACAARVGFTSSRVTLW